MISQACSIPGTSFDISTTAGLYSQASGVLAGFAFAAAFFAVTTVSTEDPSDELASSLNAFICSFFALILTTISYALLAGEPHGSEAGLEIGRGVHEELISGTLLALSALLLFHGLAHLVHSQATRRERLKSVRTLLQVISGFIGPLVGLALLLAGAADVAIYRARIDQKARGECTDIQTELLPDYIVVGAAVLILSCMLVAYRFGRLRPAPEKLQRSVPYVILGMSVVATGYAAIFSGSVDPDFVTPEAAQHVLIGVAAISLTLFGAIVMTTFPQSDE